jgi:hypothetical protein
MGGRRCRRVAELLQAAHHVDEAYTVAPRSWPVSGSPDYEDYLLLDPSHQNVKRRGHQLFFGCHRPDDRGTQAGKPTGCAP